MLTQAANLIWINMKPTLVQEALQPEPIESTIGAALERLNAAEHQQDNNTIPVGTVCHEETVGDYASYVNMQNGQ